MLRYIRIFVAIVVFVAISLLFLDTTGYVSRHFVVLARLQFIPAVLSGSLIIVAGLILLTFLFGRVYCSVVCPLGIMQDIISRIRIWSSSRTRRRIGRFGWRMARTVWRYAFLGVFVVLIILGQAGVMASIFAALIEPYGAYGRIAVAFGAPIYDWVNNLLADWSASAGNYYFTPAEFRYSATVTAVAAVTFGVVGVFAWMRGRDYCNTVCPVGTVLGLVSRVSLLRPVIDTSKCNGCRSCERHCKASCIDAKNHRVDMSRCVACMDCLSHCSRNAIRYTWRRHSGAVAAQDASEVRDGRRQFMSIVGIAAGAMAVRAAEHTVDGGLTEVFPKKEPRRRIRITPPGSVSHVHLAAKCVGCQLCVRECPNDVLRTSGDLETMMQPYLSFSEGYCTPGCTRCSHLCPTGAILPITREEKSSLKIGTAVVNTRKCVSATGKDFCGSCARHCPTGAIRMVPVNDSADAPLMPVVDAAVCIGCGSCEYHCPVGTVPGAKGCHSAIYVEGLSVQRYI